MRTHSFVYPIVLIPALIATTCQGDERIPTGQAAQEIVAQIPEIYKKSWSVVERALDCLEEKDESSFILCQFSIETGKNNVLNFYNEYGTRYEIGIKDKKMTITKYSHHLKSVLGSCYYEVKDDFIKTLTLSIRKTLEKGQGKISTLVIVFSMAGAKIEANNPTEEGGVLYYYKLKNSKWKLGSFSEFDR